MTCPEWPPNICPLAGSSTSAQYTMYCGFRPEGKWFVYIALTRYRQHIGLFTVLILWMILWNTADYKCRSRKFHDSHTSMLSNSLDQSISSNYIDCIATSQQGHILQRNLDANNHHLNPNQNDSLMSPPYSHCW